MPETFFIEVIEIKTRKVMKRFGPYPTRRVAERQEPAVARDLDGRKFFTWIKREQTERT